MRKVQSLAFIFGLVLLAITSVAQEGKILSMGSPKLREFLVSNPAAIKFLSRTFSETFKGKEIQVFYFYTDDDFRPRAFHWYPDEAQVGICIRENQEPIDEFICLFFETQNAQGEKQFKELDRKAVSGEISKENFAREVLKVEFGALRRTRSALIDMKLDETQILKSYFYRRTVDCPEKFDDFIPFSIKTSPGGKGNPLKDLEAQYDSMRKHE